MPSRRRGCSVASMKRVVTGSWYPLASWSSGVALPVELADAAHADLPHVLPNDRGQRDWEVPRVGVDLEAKLAEPFDGVSALPATASQRSTRSAIEAGEARGVVADAADHSANRRRAGSRDGRGPMRSDPRRARGRRRACSRPRPSFALSTPAQATRLWTSTMRRLDRPTSRSSKLLAVRRVAAKDRQPKVDAPALLGRRLVGAAGTKPRTGLEARRDREARRPRRAAPRPPAPPERQGHRLGEPHSAETAGLLAVGEPEAEAPLAERRSGIARGFEGHRGGHQRAPAAAPDRSRPPPSPASPRCTMGAGLTTSRAFGLAVEITVILWCCGISRHATSGDEDQGHAETPIARMVREAIETVATPEVRVQILHRALHMAREHEIPQAAKPAPIRRQAPSNRDGVLPRATRPPMPSCRTSSRW